MLKLNTKESIADVEARNNAERAESAFKYKRSLAVEAATVTVNGNIFNADERAIQRMTSAVTGYGSAAADLPVKWSMADTPSGVMDVITLGELREALQTAVIQMGELWSR